MVEKRNIVLITLDSLRADHCSFMGYHRKTTPTMDKMARKGLYFKNVIAPTLPTFPSMFCVFTAQDYSIAVDILPTRKKRKEYIKRKNIAEVLSSNGYNTVAVHMNPWASRLYGFNKGFRHFYDFLDNDGLNTDRNPSLFSGIKAFFKKKYHFINWEDIYPTIEEIMSRIKQPYFLWILLLDTHFPYIPPKSYRKYGCRSILLLIYLNWKLRKNYIKNNLKLRDNILIKEREKLIGAYDDCIRYADEFIRRLWDDLKDDDPIFIIHGDHGEGFGEHGIYYHPAFLYEELIHVPLVIYNADVKGVIEKPVSLLNIAPTILKLVGLKNEFSTESLLDSNRDWVVSRVFGDNKKVKVAVRLRDWKYITGQKEEDELYYLKKDPYEQENVIDEHPNLVKELKKIANIIIKHEYEKMQIQKMGMKLKNLG